MRRLRLCGLDGLLLPYTSCQVDQLAMPDISSAILGLSLLKCREEALLSALVSAAAQSLPSCSSPSQAISLASSLGHASALLGITTTKALMQRIADLLVSDPPTWSSLSLPDMVRLVLSFVVHDYWHDRLLRAVGETLVTQGSSSSSNIKELVTLGWGMSSLGYKNDTVRDVVARAAVGHVAELSVEGLGQLARALTVWGPPAGGDDTLMLEVRPADR